MIKNNHKHATTDGVLRAIFKSMDAHQAQEIREGYYKAVEGLRTLADTLEVAYAKKKETAAPLFVEYIYAVEALDAMKRSRLGAIL